MQKVALHGAPRSGTTWLANIFNSHENVAYRQQPLFSYAFKSFLDESSSLEKIEDFFSGIYESKDEYLNQIQAIKDGKIPKFNKKEATHIVYKEVRYHYVLPNMLDKSSVKLIGIIRNPIAVLASFFKAPSEFEKVWKKEEEWKFASKKNQGLKESYYGYEKWKETAEIFQKLEERYGKDRVILIKYSDLLKDTLIMTEDLFGKVGLEITDQTINFIEECKSYDHPNAYSVFRTKSIDDAWKNSVSENIITEIYSDLKNTNLEQYLTI